MTFAAKAWKVLVAIKDGLVLLLLLVFFWAIYSVLTYRPGPAMVREGALYLPLNGRIVEEKTQVAPLSLLLSGQAPDKEFLVRDLVRGLETAATDDRIKAVAIDLEDFGASGIVDLQRVGAAMDKVRAANKPVLVRSPIYTTGRMVLAAHASEVWVDPVGGVLLTGPGGSRLYYKGLLDRLKVEAHVFRVGTYKSAVEPYMRADASPEAEEADRQLYGAVWQQVRDNIVKARPRAQIDRVTGDPVAWLAASGNDAAEAAKAAGLVDRIGDKVAFGRRVAELAGADDGAADGTYRRTGFAAWLADNPAPDDGKPIAVVTVAGDIIDGEAGPGMAGGDRIAKLIDDAVAADRYAALVVRIDSPGGSVTASERIRAAVERARAKKLPVAISMGNVTASGGYWVATAGQRIFAEPATITGSIGIFGVVPTFERTLADHGVTTDGLRTTPLAGQPDLIGGLSPEMEAVMQGQIEAGYRRFIGLVGKARGKTPQQVDAIAQGRVWDGGTARQLGLVDQFGGIEDALAWAAKAAGAQEWHAEYLGDQPDAFSETVMAMLGGGEDDASGGEGAARDLVALAAAEQQQVFVRMGADLDRLTRGAGAQAWCMECAGLGTGAPRIRQGTSLVATLLALLR